jgi:hypothetical protein
LLTPSRNSCSIAQVRGGVRVGAGLEEAPTSMSRTCQPWLMMLAAFAMMLAAFFLS